MKKKYGQTLTDFSRLDDWVYFVVSMTGRVERFLGKGGIYIIRKFFGIILLAISVRLFMANISLLLDSFHH